MLLLTIIISTGSCYDSADDRHEIKIVWANYITAYHSNMGSECVKYMDSATINYYAYVLKLIRSVDSVTLENLRLDQKLMVLTARHELPVEKIMKMDGRAYLEYCVQTSPVEGFTNKKYLDIISVNRNQAKVQIVDSSGKVPVPIDFVKENGKWKINMTTALALVGKDAWDEILKERLKETGQTEREYIYSFLEDNNHIKPINSVWHPCCP